MDPLNSFADPPGTKKPSAVPVRLKNEEKPKFPREMLHELSLFAYKPPQAAIDAALGSLPPPRTEALGVGKPTRH